MKMATPRQLELAEKLGITGVDENTPYAEVSALIDNAEPPAWLIAWAVDLGVVTEGKKYSDLSDEVIPLANAASVEILATRGWVPGSVSKAKVFTNGTVLVGPEGVFAVTNIFPFDGKVTVRPCRLEGYNGLLATVEGRHAIPRAFRYRGATAIQIG
jgi:hypothetical protein